MIEWETGKGLIPLHRAVLTMEERVSQIYEGEKNQLIWMLEHPHVYSGGTSSQPNHLLIKPTIPIELTKRGGSYTYHGPGQRIIYVMLDLTNYGKDIRKFVWNLEQWVIDSLEQFGLAPERRPKRIGIWIAKQDYTQTKDFSDREFKIASIGLRVKYWISYFGISINVDPELEYFNGIIPCGNIGYGVTSMRQQGLKTSLTELDIVLKQQFESSMNKSRLI